MTKQHNVHANISIGIAVLIIGFFQFGCTQSSSFPKGEVNILNKEPDTTLASHKQYDIEVYKSFFIYGDGYFIKHYHKEKGILLGYTGIIGDSTEFDKAAYHWINDTSVSVKLYNSASKRERVFKLSGYELRNSLETFD